jgi:HPt (histidine-containing phosphotransfer) domain-containing protein
MLDPAAIENLRSISPDDGGEFLRELIDIFLADTPLRLAELELACTAGNAKAVTRAAHSLKGSSGAFGATHFTQLAAQLEISSRTGDLTAARDGLSHLRGEFARLLPAFAQLKATGA